MKDLREALTKTPALERNSNHNPSNGPDIVEIPSSGGLCRFIFESYISTGPQESDTCPGVSIHIQMDPEVYALVGRHPGRDEKGETFIMPGGVVGREGLKLLYNMLQRFLVDQGEI